MPESAIKKFSDYGLIDNDRVKLLQVLKEVLKSGDYREIDITVGYLFLSGLEQLKEEMDEFFKNGGKMRIVMGSITNKETHETLAMIYQSLEDLQEEWNRKVFSKGSLDEDISIYSKNVGVMEQNEKNAQFLEKLKEWIESRALEIRVYTKEYMHAKAYLFKTKSGTIIGFGAVGSSNFSLGGFSGNTELNAMITSTHMKNLEDWFEKIWNEAEDFNPQLLRIIENSWASNVPGQFPPPYHVLIKGLIELYGPVEDSGKVFAPTLMEKLYDFQKDAVKRAIDIINKYGGVLISDVVGLGKSYIGLALLQHFSIMSITESNEYRPRVAVFAPPKLVSMWRFYLSNFHINGVVFSTGWLLQGPEEDGTPSLRVREIMRELKDVGVILIDEAHKISNPRSNTYINMQRLIGNRKVILLTATPYRKSFEDIVRQIQLFMPGEYHKFPISPPKWKDVIKAVEEGILDPSYILREIMVRRTRRDIITLYGEGKDSRCIKKGREKECFPVRELETISYNISSVYSLKYASMESIEKVIKMEDGSYYGGKPPESYQNIYEVMLAGIRTLLYTRYDLYRYVKENYKKAEPYRDLKHAGRNLRGIMKTHYLKRLESSAHAFYLSLKKSLAITETFLRMVELGYMPVGEEFDDMLYRDPDNPRPLRDDEIEKLIEDIKKEYGEIEKSPLRTYKLNSFKISELKKALAYDIEKLRGMVEIIEKVHSEVMRDPWKDEKLKALAKKIDEILSSSDKRKVLVFSEYEDTVKWIYNGLKKIVEKGYIKHPELWKDKMEYASSSSNVESIAARFSPGSMAKTSSYALAIAANIENEIDVLITTDVMSEGMNLQDANYVVNYDLHWTPYKIIQRIGRIDRIGSEYDKIKVINFLPETDLDKKLNLLEKVRRRAEEFMTTLGEDGKLITEEDRFNPSAMEAIYGGNIEKIEEEIEEGGISITTSAAKVLEEFRGKYPDKYSELRNAVSIRSVGCENIGKNVAFFVCSDGITSQYYTYEYVNGEWKRIYLSIDYFINAVKEDTPACIDYSMEEYYKVADLALKEYKRILKEIEGVETYGKVRLSKGTKELIRRLRQIGTSTRKDAATKKLALEYKDFLQWGIANVEGFKNEVNKITSRKGWKNKSDADILELVRILLDSYNIPEKKRDREKNPKRNSPRYFRPHIAAGLVLIKKS